MLRLFRYEEALQLQQTMSVVSRSAQLLPRTINDNSSANLLLLGSVLFRDSRGRVGERERERENIVFAISAAEVPSA